MTRKQEMARLKEIRRIYQNPEERIAAYNRCKWTLFVIAWFVISVAVFLTREQLANNIVSLTIAGAGGALLGLAVWLSEAAKRIPLLLRYTALREEEIRKRLDELQDARPAMPEPQR
jgi:hypothetical protein